MFQHAKVQLAELAGRDDHRNVNMAIQTAPLAVHPSSATIDVKLSDADASPVLLDVANSYDGSNVVFRLLRLESWGPALMNLGFHRFGSPFSMLNLFTNLELAQQRLVSKSAELLEIKCRHRILDAACGRGKSSFIIHCAHPGSSVVGVDLLERNIQVARTLFDQIQNLSYVTGNAMALDFRDESFDRVICLEAAFHFPDRSQFLREAFRVLSPGGKLIVVDFAWNSDADRRRLNSPEVRLVRDIWQWDDMYSIPEYPRIARESGFRMLSSHDWSHRVTAPIQGLFQCLALLGNNRWGRQFLQWRNPLYRSVSHNDWKALARASRAHDYMRHCSKYMAFVFEK